MKIVFVWLGALAVTAFWGTVSALSSVIDRSGGLGFRCMKNWARSILVISGCKITVTGAEKLSTSKNYLFISNHQSQADIIALSAALPVKFAFMAKKVLFKVPFVGWHMKTMGYIAIDRKSISSSLQGLNNASRALKEGASMVIFAEGSRSKDGSLKPFKDGAFYLAIDSGIPIVPVVIKGTSQIIRKGSMKVYPGTIKVDVLDEIKVDKYVQSDRDELKDFVRGMISKGLTSD